MVDFLLVFSEARQIVCKEFLFVKEPPYPDWHHKNIFRPKQAERLGTRPAVRPGPTTT